MRELQGNLRCQYDLMMRMNKMLAFIKVVIGDIIFQFVHYFLFALMI